MDGKDDPPPYTAEPAQQPPMPQTQMSQNQMAPPPQTMYQYPGMSNYGYNQQPIQYGLPQTGMAGIVITQVADVGYNAPPQDYTTQAWLSCLCCFWPTGILAIMRANESRDALARGDMNGAHLAANGARSMVRASVIIGIISVVFAVVIVVIYVAIIATSYNNYNNYD